MARRKQKRFTDYSSIIFEITDAQRKVQTKLREADAMDAEADTMRNKPDMAEDLEFRRKLATKLRRHALMIENTKIKSLQNALAEFETATLPGIISDRAVVLKKKKQLEDK
jgi:hypothetical protein